MAPSSKRQQEQPQPQQQQQQQSHCVYQNPRLMHVCTSIVGHVVHIQTNDGSIWEGIFNTFSPEFTICLNFAIQLDPKLKDDCLYAALKRGLKAEQQSFFDVKNIVRISVADIDLNYATKEMAGRLATDADISGFDSSKLSEGKELESWQDEDGDTTNADLMMSLDDVANKSGNQSTSRGWAPEQMFGYNERVHKVTSTYDDKLTGYTVPVKPQQSKEVVERAEAVAKEIESSKKSQIRASKEDGSDCEEEKFSAVQRPVPANNTNNTVNNTDANNTVKSYQRFNKFDRNPRPRTLIEPMRNFHKNFQLASSAKRQQQSPQQQQPQQPLQQPQQQSQAPSQTQTRQLTSQSQQQPHQQQQQSHPQSQPHQQSQSQPHQQPHQQTHQQPHQQTHQPTQSQPTSQTQSRQLTPQTQPQQQPQSTSQAQTQQQNPQQKQQPQPSNQPQTQQQQPQPTSQAQTQPPTPQAHQSQTQSSQSRQSQPQAQQQNNQKQDRPDQSELVRKFKLNPNAKEFVYKPKSPTAMQSAATVDPTNSSPMSQAPHGYYQQVPIFAHGVPPHQQQHHAAQFMPNHTPLHFQSQLHYMSPVPTHFAPQQMPPRGYIRGQFQNYHPRGGDQNHNNVRPGYSQSSMMPPTSTGQTYAPPPSGAPHPMNTYAASPQQPMIYGGISQSMYPVVQAGFPQHMPHVIPNPAAPYYGNAVYMPPQNYVVNPH